MMRELGLAPSAAAIAKHYGGLVDAWVIDSKDANCASEIEALGMKTAVTDTLMTSRARSTELAGVVLDLAARLGKQPMR
jgi:LPPG:FO 2-phospho-L-lactate transferase